MQVEINNDVFIEILPDKRVFTLTIQGIDYDLWNRYDDSDRFGFPIKIDGLDFGCVCVKDNATDEWDDSNIQICFHNYRKDNHTDKAKIPTETARVVFEQFDGTLVDSSCFGYGDIMIKLNINKLSSKT